MLKITCNEWQRGISFITYHFVIDFIDSFLISFNFMSFPQFRSFLPFVESCVFNAINIHNSQLHHAPWVWLTWKVNKIFCLRPGLNLTWYALLRHSGDPKQDFMGCGFLNFFRILSVCFDWSNDLPILNCLGWLILRDSRMVAASARSPAMPPKEAMPSWWKLWTRAVWGGP